MKTTSTRKATKRPDLYVVKGALHEMTVRALDALEAVNHDSPFLFRHGSSYVRFRSDFDGPMLEKLTGASLRQIMAERTAWWTRDGSGGSSGASPPVEVMVNMLVTTDWPVPSVERIVEVPVFGPDGTVQTRPGYQAGSRVCYSPSPGLHVPPVSDNPTAEEVEKARRIIVEELLGDFPFVAASDRAQAVEALLMPFARGLFDGPSPAHLASAPTPGTGKSLLAHVLASPAAGDQLPVQTGARFDDEWAKKISAVLSSGPTVILIDNLEGKISSASLSAVLTATMWTDRLLGRNDTVVRYPNRALWIATANNADLAADLIRRTVPIRLDTEEERPSDRDPSRYRHPKLLRWAAENRGLLVRSALTLIRAWIVAGRPPGARTIGSYEEWSTTMGGILQVAGIDGFLDDIDEFRAEFDAESASWVEFFTALSDSYGITPFSTARALQVYDLGDDFLSLGDENLVTARSRQTKLGRALVKARNRVHGGLRLKEAGESHGGNLWRLIDTNGG